MSVLQLIRHRNVTAIVGDIVRVDIGATSLGVPPRFGDLAFVQDENGAASLAQIVRLDVGSVSLQLFKGAMGMSTRASVTFLGRPPQVAFSSNVLGRTFNGLGATIDGGPSLDLESRILAQGAIVNPSRRELASRLIRTDVPMIDVFNTLVESQKIPIFSVPGEPYNALLARIGVQADSDIVVFVGLGLSFDDLHMFQTAFAEAGVAHRTVSFVNLASDPVLERLVAPDLALALAERFAVADKRRVLVLMTDMTAFADALKEVGVALDRIPANRGYTGDLYSQLARRYERACDFKGGGSVTIMTVTTMPGQDVTHPVPDNTGYITEGQIYIHGGVIDPFGSLSRLKQHVVGIQTRDDHPHVMNAMIRLYGSAQEARLKQSMAFDLSEFDRRLLAYGDAFRTDFMRLDARMSIESALDRGWQLMASFFTPDEIQIRPSIMQRFHPGHRQVS